MKRFLLPAILLFPIVSLICWVYWGTSQRKKLPEAMPNDTNVPALSTNGAAGK
jgi:hypothetical protein